MFVGGEVEASPSLLVTGCQPKRTDSCNYRPVFFAADFGLNWKKPGKKHESKLRKR